MSDRLNQSQKIEATELLKRQNTVMAQMVGFSLEQLEASTNGLMNQNRVKNMTVSDLTELKRLDRSLTLQLGSDIAIDAYTLPQMKADVIFMAEFYTEPLRSELLNAANTMTDAEFVQSKNEMKLFAGKQRTAATNAAADHIETARLEGFSLEFRQARMLRNVPGIGKLVERAKAEAKTLGLSIESDEGTEILIKSVTDAAFQDLVKIVETNYTLVSQIQNQARQKELNDQINAQLNIRVAGANNAKDGVGEIMRLAGGIADYKDMYSNPLLVAVMSPSDLKKANDSFMKSLQSNGQSPDNLRSEFYATIETNVRKILKGTNLDQIDNHFRPLYLEDGSHEDPERIKRDKEIMVKKLRTVPKQWRSEDEAKLYETYVKENGPDSYDFMEALDRGFLGDVGWMRKLWMQLLGWWEMGKEVLRFDDEDKEGDTKEWDRIEHYQTEVKNTGEDGAGNVRSLTPEAVKQNKLFAALKEKVGNLNITDNGKPFEIKNDADSVIFETINSTYGNLEGRYPMLRSGIDVDDLVFLAKNTGDEWGQKGINVSFKDDGIDLTYDMGRLLEGYWEELAVGGSVAALAYFTTNPLGWISSIALGVTAAGVTTGLLNLDGLTGETINYSDLDPKTVHAKIEEVKAWARVAKEAVQLPDLNKYVENFSQYEDLFADDITQVPAAMFVNNGELAPAFEGFLRICKNNPSFANRKITQADLNMFAKALDGFTGMGGSIDYDDPNAFYESDGKFYVNGSGWKVLGAIDPFDLTEEGYTSLEKLFADLRDDGTLNNGS